MSPLAVLQRFGSIANLTSFHEPQGLKRHGLTEPGLLDKDKEMSPAIPQTGLLVYILLVNVSLEVGCSERTGGITPGKLFRENWGITPGTVF